LRSSPPQVTSWGSIVSFSSLRPFSFFLAWLSQFSGDRGLRCERIGSVCLLLFLSPVEDLLLPLFGAFFQGFFGSTRKISGGSPVGVFSPPKLPLIEPGNRSPAFVSQSFFFFHLFFPLPLSSQSLTQSISLLIPCFVVRWEMTTSQGSGARLFGIAGTSPNFFERFA